MKAEIHPTYFSQATVTCTCGNTFKTGSTREEIRVDICSNCHPLWTGEQKFVDTKGQIGKFEEKQKIAEQYKAQAASKKKADKKKGEKPQSLKDLLMGL